MVFALGFAALLGIASIFSRRGLENGTFNELLVISLAVGSPIFLIGSGLTTGFAGTPPTGILYAAIGSFIGSVVGRSFYFQGINYLGPGKSLSINATSPLYAAVLAWVFLDESITLLILVGSVVVVLGIAFLSRDVRTETDRQNHSLAVVLFPLAGAVCGAIAVIFRKIALNAGIAPVEAGAVNMVVGLVVVSPLVATRWRDKFAAIDPEALRNFLVASAFMSAGFLFYFVGLEITSTVVFFPLIQTQPLFAIMLSALFLGQFEVVTRWTVVGGIVIAAGAMLVIVG